MASLRLRSLASPLAMLSAAADEADANALRPVASRLSVHLSLVSLDLSHVCAMSTAAAAVAAAAQQRE